MATAQQFLTVLRSFIGIHEEPDGSNRTSLGDSFGWNGVAWCAISQSVALKRVGMDWWTASTDEMEKWARAGRQGAKWLPPTATPRPGDLCIWDYKHDGTANHVSAVESTYADARLNTLGGNEQNRFQRAVRSRKDLRGFIRLPFSVPAAPAPTHPPTHSVTHPVLRKGDRRIEVKELQNKLNVASGAGLPITGNFLARTDKAVRSFQKFFHLEEDGVVGKNTWGVLDYAYALHHGH